jgi:peptidoglycan hydrolase-like protein with peptidoglycan-binding domain
MSGRKQKSPDRRRNGRKQAPRPAGLLLRLLSSVAALAARHPKPLVGGVGFVVLFSFVAANALWYQPGGHPAPFLATRDPNDPNRIAGYRPRSRTPSDGVTTFRIERAPDQPASPASAPSVAPVAAPFPAQNGSPLAQPLPQAMPQPQTEPARPLVADVQRELSRRGLYDGAEDGVMGSRTQAAILFYQESAGLAQTGEPSAELLASLKAEPSGSKTISQGPAGVPQQVAAPMPRPAMPDNPRREPAKNVQAAGRPASAKPAEKAVLHADDPIAAAIRSSERNPLMTPPADIPTGTAKPVRPVSDAPVAGSQLVLQIQKGLSNIAYTDVEMDGVAGAQTKAAIRRFERHYRLPETGEPSEAVLKKLKAIGAL